jgi:hypothetical protein
MKTRTQANSQADSPLLVMAIDGGWFGHDKHQCIFAAVRLLPSIVESMRAVSQVSHDIGGTELLLGHWPVLWDQNPHLGIDKTVWRVSGNRHWAEAFDADGLLLGRTVYLDAREFPLMDGEVIWHETDAAELALEDMLHRPFIDFASERLTAMGLMEIGAAPPESKAAIRGLLLELED